MFLDRMTETQKRCFLNLANRVILADWLVPPDEETMLMDLARELGSTVTVDAKSLWGKVDLSPFHGQAVRNLLVFELYLVAEADDTICRGEAMVIDEVARDLEISPENQEMLRALAHEQHVVDRARLDRKDQADRRNGLLSDLGFPI
ncbi:MAG: hypothetical protein K9H25_00240 [Rhodospirillum sp.]|nr:hypothetical protein [Rhodospirillum sp.]MCF8488176.1 hypothetical protein [Rhodospirillum sp.]MCF8501933.1 hypothetical protein [Rhodospirillum sp.]